MDKIIEPVDPRLIVGELSEDKMLCRTSRGGNVLYVIDAADAPNTLREIGRLRELSFRPTGGCSGLSCDLDRYDLKRNAYRQLIVWDPVNQEILGGYRFFLCDRADMGADGQPDLASSALFRFSDTFIRDYLPTTVELGRAFVSPGYRSSEPGARSLFVLDNLFQGIASVMAGNPGMKYYFGKITFPPTYCVRARDMIYHFLKLHFPPREQLVWPRNPQPCETDPHSFDGIFSGRDGREDYFLLKRALREMGEALPPILNTYIRSTNDMMFFGAAVNERFGNVSECAVLVPADGIEENVRFRYFGG